MQVAGDPRRPNDIVKYKRHVVKDDDLPDTYLMAALCLGMAALLLKVKLEASVWGNQRDEDCQRCARHILGGVKCWLPLAALVGHFVPV